LLRFARNDGASSWCGQLSWFLQAAKTARKQRAASLFSRSSQHPDLAFPRSTKARPLSFYGQNSKNSEMRITGRFFDVTYG
jgi:hypothetical protein